jgi:hypothetical protein
MGAATGREGVKRLKHGGGEPNVEMILDRISLSRAQRDQSLHEAREGEIRPGPPYRGTVWRHHSWICSAGRYFARELPSQQLMN